MRRATASLAVLVCILAACQQAPRNRWAQERVVLTGLQDGTGHLHEAGALTDADILALDPFFQQARQALEISQALLPILPRQMELIPGSDPALAEFNAWMTIAASSIDRARDEQQRRLNDAP